MLRQIIEILRDMLRLATLQPRENADGRGSRQHDE
ncbi:hypothetical protein QE408_001925 [Agrobacterium larrymoorei]|uniref:Uncharacterized protein n=1 Tax=Agrobacterium larrymoorei TaxID=160699 RepID=A0ABU0UIL7_9HYPH|nr:hypothetical protein [Agrobacterium larrymoorei]